MSSARDRSGRWSGLAVWLCLALLAAVVPVVVSAQPAAADVGGPNLTLQTSGGLIRDDSVVSSGTDMTTAVGGLLEAGNGTRELRIDLDAATIYKAGGVTAPEGWTIEWSVDNGTNWVSPEPTPASDVTSVRASATVDAGAPNGASQSYTKQVISPVPASTFSGSTGGDGWDIFFYDDYVLNIFHHSTFVAVDCHLRSSGARCTGFDPTQTTGPAYSKFDGYLAGNRSGGWVDGNTGYAYAFTADANSGSPTLGQPGTLCVDLNVAPPITCGFTALSSNTNVTQYTYLSNAEGVGGRLFGMDSLNQELLCFDPQTEAPCAGSPLSLSGTNSINYYHVAILGSRVFASTDTTLYCYESSTLDPCTGAWPVSYASLSWTAAAMSPVAHMDSAGTVDGVCMWNGCLDMAGADQTYHATNNPTGWVNPHSITSWAGSAGSNGSSGSYGRFEATAGRAYLQMVLSGNNTVYCFDYATEAACAGFDTTPTTDIQIYALRVDPNNPSCVWYNSHPGKIGLFDAYTGANECSASPVITLQPSAFAPRFVCTTSGGIDRWTSLTLDTVAGGTPAGQTLTVRTGNGDAVAGWIDRPITIGQTLSLADLSVTATGARPTFNIAFSGVTGALTSADFTILYEGRGPELCVDFTVDNTAAPGAPNCPVVQSIVGTLSQNVSGPVSNTALSRSFTASGDNTECPESIVYAGPPDPVRSLSTVPNGPGASTVTFLESLDDGGSPIRWYELSTDGGTTWIVVPNSPNGSGMLTHQLTGLTPGNYTVVVRALNLLGTSTNEQASADISSEPTTTTTQPTTSTTRESDPNGALPDLDPGTHTVTDNGNPVTVVITPTDDGTGVDIDSGDGVSIQLTGECEGGGCQVKQKAGGDPYLQINSNGDVRATGQGFMPGSLARVWISPGSVYLGSVVVGQNGTFDKSFPVTVAAGQHTLHIQGVTTTGGERSASLGLVVVASGSGSGDPGPLALTGSNATTWYMLVGLIVALLGAAILLVWRFSGRPVAAVGADPDIS